MKDNCSISNRESLATISTSSKLENFVGAQSLAPANSHLAPVKRGGEFASSMFESFDAPSSVKSAAKSVGVSAPGEFSSVIFDSFDAPPRAKPAVNALKAPVSGGFSSDIFDSFDAPPRVKPAVNALKAPVSCGFTSDIFDSFDAPLRVKPADNALKAPFSGGFSSDIFDSFDAPPRAKPAANALKAPVSGGFSSEIFDSFDAAPRAKPAVNTFKAPVSGGFSSDIFDSFDAPTRAKPAAKPKRASGSGEFSSDIFDSFDAPLYTKADKPVKVQALNRVLSDVLDKFDTPPCAKLADGLVGKQSKSPFDVGPEKSNSDDSKCTPRENVNQWKIAELKPTSHVLAPAGNITRLTSQEKIQGIQAWAPKCTALQIRLFPLTAQSSQDQPLMWLEDIVAIAKFVIAFCDQDETTSNSQSFGISRAACDSDLDKPAKAFLCSSYLLGTLTNNKLLDATTTPVVDLWDPDNLPLKNGILVQSRPRSAWELGRVNDFIIWAVLSCPDSQRRVLERIGAIKPIATNAGNHGRHFDYVCFVR
jgi:hypothetical protein